MRLQCIFLYSNIKRANKLRSVIHLINFFFLSLIASFWHLFKINFFKKIYIFKCFCIYMYKINRKLINVHLIYFIRILNLIVLKKLYKCVYIFYFFLLYYYTQAYLYFLHNMFVKNYLLQILLAQKYCILCKKMTFTRCDQIFDLFLTK